MNKHTLTYELLLKKRKEGNLNLLKGDYKQLDLSFLKTSKIKKREKEDISQGRNSLSNS
jgi:hypothetical protein